MTQAKPKRFYQSVQIEPFESLWRVCLDDKPIKTPARSDLALPNQGLASLVADEWRQQVDFIDIPKMHLTRLCHVALDRTPTTRAELVEESVRYAGTDVCCYRVDGPAALADRQAASFDPVLDWLAEAYGIRLLPTSDVLPNAQPHESLDMAAQLAAGLDDFALTGLVYGCGLLGSYGLALALLAGFRDADTAFEASRIEEAWQVEHWGADDEAVAISQLRREEVRCLATYFTSLGLERDQN